MPFANVSEAPYTALIDHTSDAHNAAVEEVLVAFNGHTHDPGDTTGGNYGMSIPAWGPSNPLYGLHGPGGGIGGNDWGATYNAQAAIPADPSETAVDPATGALIQQSLPPTTLSAAYGVQGHIQRLYGALARLKATSTVTGSVQAAPSPTTAHINVAVGTGTQYKTGVPITAGAQSSIVSTIVGDQITVSPVFGSTPTAGQTVTQKTGNWWDPTQVAQLGNTPQSGNMTIAAGYNVIADQFVSQVAPGTPPLTVLSASKVTLLNADYIDGYHAWETTTGSAGGLLPAPNAPTSSAPTNGGTLTVGVTRDHVVTFVTAAGGETLQSLASTAQTPSGSNRQIPLTGIQTGPPNVISRKVYGRNGGAGAYGLVGTIADNTTTTFLDTGFALGAAPPSTATATYEALIPALNNHGYMAPGYVEYDAAEASTFDTLVSGQSSVVNSLNRIRNQVVGLLVAAGGSWGTVPTSLVTSLRVAGDSSGTGGDVALQAGANVTLVRTGSTLTIAALSGGSITLADSSNIVLGTGVGSKIGTSSSQKLGVWGATPIARPASTGGAVTAGATWNATSQAMLNDVYSMARSLGLLS